MLTPTRFLSFMFSMNADTITLWRGGSRDTELSLSLKQKKTQRERDGGSQKQKERLISLQREKSWSHRGVRVKTSLPDLFH